MSHRSRELTVRGLARVEGEGALRLTVRDGQVARAELNIYEPPRFFEAFLRGRGYTEPPDITARICGICPVAYQTSACNAIEQACGAALDPPLAELRRLLYCGEWISSHALHIYFLHAPDFLGYPDAITLAQDHRAIVERGLELKKAGNAILEFLGGRAIHPVNVRVGGFYRVPAPGELRPFAEQLRRALDLAVGTVQWAASFDFPELELGHDLLSAHDPGPYAIESGDLRSASGLPFPASDFPEPRRRISSPAFHRAACHPGRHRYLAGPLARYSLSRLPLPDRQRSRRRRRARRELP